MGEEWYREGFAEDKRLSEDRGENFRGTVRVSLRRLAFPPEYSREIDKKNVERLKKIFNQPGGCLRLSPPNYIPAIIDQQDLDLAIESTGTTLEKLLNGSGQEPPMLKLPPNYSLRCLHGQHRILAALEVLKPRDEWWTVHLYLSALSPDARAALSEEYSNSLSFADGEIYRKVRHYQSKGRHFPESKWRAYLSRDKQKDLRRLLKRRDYTTAFDKLRDIRGLWSGFGFGKVHMMLGLKCREELLHYLDHTLAIWSKVLEGDRKLMRKTDNLTVQALQLRAPGSSSDDVRVLRRLLEDGILFSKVKDQGKREVIWKNLLSVEGLIPSLYTFFEDLKFLKGPEKIIRYLIEPPFKDSLREMIEQQYSDTNQSSDIIYFQDTEATLKSAKAAPAEGIKFGYRQLWLYAMRHFPKMIGECPKKEKDRPKPMILEPDPIAWYKFASLASQLGFDSPTIRRLMADDPYRKRARQFLRKNHPSESFTFDEVEFESCVEQIASTLATATEKKRPPILPTLVTEGAGEGIPRRCGRFFETAYDHDRELLFLETIHGTFTEQRGNSITSFYVRRSVYFAFFGKQLPRVRGDNTDTLETPPPPVHAARDDRSVPEEPEQHSQATNTGNELALVQTLPSPERDVETTGQGLANGEIEKIYSPPRRIFLRVYKEGGLEEDNRPLVCDPDLVKRAVLKYTRKAGGYAIMDIAGRGLTLENCFDAVVEDGSYTIVLVPESEPDYNRLRIGYGVGTRASGSESETQKRRQIMHR